MHTHTMRCALAALAGGLLVAGCGGSSGGDDGSSSGSGTANFKATDAPVDDASRVQITIDRVEFKPADAEGEESFESLDLIPNVTLDLLELQGGQTEVIENNVELPAGEYEQIRLFLVNGIPDGADCTSDSDASCVVDGRGTHELFVPGNQPPSQNPNNNPLKLVDGFTVTAGGTTDFVIDFELRKALTDPQNDDWYFLRPALRLIDQSETGTIKGTVQTSLVTQPKCSDSTGQSGSAVYLYQEADATPGDIWVDAEGQSQRGPDATEHDPLATTNVTWEDTDDDGTADEHRYTLAFVPAKNSDYTVAFTCQAGGDDPRTDDDTEFDQQHNVRVEADETTDQDFSSGN